MCILDYFIPMDSSDIAAYRFLGALGSIFTSCQSIIWFMLCVLGIGCTYLGCGSEANKKSFQYCFYLYYFYQPENITLTRMNYINPTQFHQIMMFHAAMSFINIVISILTASAFVSWKQPKTIRRMSCIWTTSILLFSLFELLTFIIFATDVITIKRNDGAKCFVDNKVMNLTAFLSSDTIVRRPAPYLLNLKSNLKKMQKKIKYFNRNLLFLKVLLDENSQKRPDSPFGSKRNVNRHVKAIWQELFNSSIQKNIRREPYVLPFDEELRNFIIEKQLVLDDVDYHLLTDFDLLTNRKWMKPIERSNVTFQKEYNLNETLAADSSANIKKIIKLLSNKIAMENKINNKIARKYDEEEQESIIEIIKNLIHPTGPTTTTTTTTKKPNLYFLDLCKNCNFFVLTPSVLCMILSLKTGLVWLMNIIIAILVGCYGSNSAIRLKRKNC